MKGINKKYNIELEVLTPLSIGAGAEKDLVKGADFVVNENCLYKLNLKKMVSDGIDLTRLTSYIANKDSDGIVKLLGNKLESVSDFSINMPTNSDNDIKAFVKNQLSGNPIIPGSSLKGAIRSVLFQYLDGKSKNGQEVFGSSTEGDEFMRFIKVSDAEFDTTNLVNTKIFNLQNTGGWKGGWKHGGSNTNSKFNPTGFNTLYECIMPQQKGYVSLMLSDKLYDNFEQNKRLHIKTEKKRPILQNGIETLFAIINKHTKDYLQKEKAFFQKFSTDKTDSIIKSIDALLAIIPSDNSYCILKMSAGSGFHSITGDWQFDDYTINGLDTSKKVSRGLYNNQKSSKSRKIAVWNDNFSLMGFVKMSVLTDEQINAIKEEKERKLKGKEEIKLKEQQQMELEAKRIAEKKQKKETFKALIVEADNLYDEHRLEEALSKYNEAATICQGDNAVLQRLKVINDELKLKQNELDTKQLETEGDSLFAEQKYEEAKQKYEEADKLGCKSLYEKISKCSDKIAACNGSIDDFIKLTSIAACAGGLRKWISVHGKLSDKECSIASKTIKSGIEHLKKSDQKAWFDYKKWKPIIDVVGEECAKKIYDCLNQ